VSRVQRLVVVLALNLALVASLVIVGVTAHSLAVLAAGGDYLLDAAGICVALLAIHLSARPGRRASRLRPTNVAALVNAGWLLVLEVLVAGAAIGRLVAGAPEVDGLPVLIVSAVAALAMTAGALILRGDDDDDREEDADGTPGDRDASIAAVLLDTVADAAAAAGVAVTGAIILATGSWYWLDPAVALAIAVVVAYHALALIRKVVTSPGGTGSGPAKINPPSGALQSDGDQRGAAAWAGAARARHRAPRGVQRRRVRHRHHPAGPGHRAARRCPQPPAALAR
jgi:cobalt-zinc-cadmium efflux system protein